jgi:hypothetical protein
MKMFFSGDLSNMKGGTVTIDIQEVYKKKVKFDVVLMGTFI